MSDDLTKETKATLAPITPIPDNEPYAKPSLWNARYREIDAHLGFVYSPYNLPAVENVTGLQSALDSKSPVGHKHNIADINNLQANLDRIDTKVSRAGDTMAGSLAISGATTNQFEAKSGNNKGVFRLSGADAILGTQVSEAWTGVIKVGADFVYSKDSINWLKVYHEGYKPTPDAIGAVKKSGDTMTGSLTVRGETGAVLLSASSGTTSTGLALSSTSGEGLFIVSNNAIAIAAFIRVSSVDKKNLSYGIGVDEYKIYHEGNKPTPSAIGAVKKSGDTMTGSLTVRGETGAVLLSASSGTTSTGLALSSTSGEGLFIVSNNAIAIAAFIRVSSVDKKNLSYGIGADEYKIYHEGNKPTPSAIGAATASHVHTIANVTGLQTALDGKSPVGHKHNIADINNLQANLDRIDTKVSRAGDTMTGSLTVRGETGAVLLSASSGTTSTGLALSSTSGEGLFIVSNNAIAIAAFIRVSSVDKKNLSYGIGVDEYKIYHEGNKPTASGVGAYSKLECDEKFITGIRLGSLTTKPFYNKEGWYDQSGYVITGLPNGNKDSGVDVVDGRPLQYQLAGTWYTCASI